MRICDKKCFHCEEKQGEIKPKVAEKPFYSSSQFCLDWQYDFLLSTLASILLNFDLFYIWMLWRMRLSADDVLPFLHFELIGDKHDPCRHVLDTDALLEHFHLFASISSIDFMGIFICFV